MKNKPLTASDVLEANAKFYADNSAALAELNLRFAEVQAEMMKPIIDKTMELLKEQDKKGSR